MFISIETDIYGYMHEGKIEAISTLKVLISLDNDNMMYKGTYHTSDPR